MDLPDLPEEIWQRIASFLTTKEWVATSGAHPISWHLQPEHIECTALKPSSSLSALQWLLNHWQCAKSAHVELSGMGGSWKAAYAALWSKQATKPAPLQRLSYSCKLGCPCKHRAQWGDWILQLLRRVPAVTMLELRTDFRPKIPRLSQLKHLILEGPYPKLGYAMKGLPCLETLFLSGSLNADVQEFENKFSRILMPKSLKHLRMGCICLPPGLVLPKDCTLTMVSSGQDTYVTELGDLGYFWCATEKCSIHVRHADYVFGSTPVSMFLKNEQVCLSAVPYRYLCSLSVEGDWVEVTLPAVESLQKVDIRAYEFLGLACEDVEVFAASIEALSVKCCDFDCEDGVIERLKRSLAVRGKQLIDPGNDCQDEDQMLMVPEHADLAGWETVCDCKCCGVCLRRAGVF